MSRAAREGAEELAEYSKKHLASSNHTYMVAIGRSRGHLLATFIFSVPPLQRFKFLEWARGIEWKYEEATL